MLQLFGPALLLSILALPLRAQQKAACEAKITVLADKPGHKVSPMLFGIFLEDINNSIDGGLYPELVRNVSFEDADTLAYWKFESAGGGSSAGIYDANIPSKVHQPPLNSFNPRSLRIKANGSFKLENYGYWGMNVVKGDRYTLKLAARTPDTLDTPLKIRVVGSDGQELAAGEIQGFGPEWKYHSLNLTASGNDPKAHLEIAGNGKGTLYLDMISLMPDKTWKNDGFRVDLAKALEALHPRFMRFPGGSFVEGVNIGDMYNWTHTIGPLDTRTPEWNLWGYYSTNFIGFQEYLELAHDLGAQPVFCINAGISYGGTVPMSRMGQWVQNTLDAIQYANGPVTSVWGRQRAMNGHPKPINLKYIEIGNENGGPAYYKRWKYMADAIRSKYPYMKLIADEWAGGHPTEPEPAIIDEHYYDSPDWFIYNSNKYDSYNRKGPKVFIGEYAVTRNTGKGDLRGAIGEAAWMTGMERNSDVVELGSYAPLFCNVNHQAWPVNLINFDSDRWYGLPSYYVQEMFSNNQGTVVLPTKIANSPKLKSPFSTGCIGLGTWINSAEFKDLKVVAPDGKVLFQDDFSKNIDGWRKIGRGEWSVHDGVLKQSSMAEGVTAFAGDTNWTDYTITLKARKLAGENGFQIYFHNHNNSERFRWDVGGYTNSVFIIDNGITTKTIRGGIEPGKWYDVRLVVRGSSVKGYLDGKLIEGVGTGGLNLNTLCASSEYDGKTGDIIVKVVNASFGPLRTRINLEGARGLKGTAKAVVLTSSSPRAENSLQDPTNVSPKTETVKFSGTTITRTFPGNSLTVLRIHTRK